MRMNELSQQEPEPGLLVEWRPTTRTEVAVQQRAEHPAPASPIQESHLRREVANDAAGVAHSSWLGTSFELPGRIDPDAMAAAWRQWVRRHGTMLTWFEPDADGELRRYAIAGDDVEFAPVELGEHTGPEIREHLLNRFDDAAKALHWPPFVLGAVLRAESSTVYFAVDHGHTDGYSMVLVFDELRRLYEQEITGVDPGLPEVGDHAEFAARERAAEIPERSLTAAVELWSDFWLSGGKKPAGFPLSLGLADGEAATSRLTEYELFDPRQANVFGRRCREHGGGFAAGLFVALAIASAELAGEETYRTLTPVHTRDEPRWAAAHGWFINLVPIHFELTGSRTFGEVLLQAEQAFARARGIADVPMIKLMQHLGSRLSLDGIEQTVLPMTSFMDGRRIRGHEDWQRADAQVLGGPREETDVMLWVNRAREWTCLLVSHPDTQVAAENVGRYSERVRSVLHRVVEHGDHELRREHARPEPASPG
ncbi:hypothetical protein INP57_09050 [Saccharopolyspora sp. HNM0986]|nr:hypothetical protein [Saccharopolyspora sp. HNM0986]